MNFLDFVQFLNYYIGDKNLVTYINKILGGKNMSNLVSYLFKTNAFKVCSENNPFWYTSGLIGPYFINTHFLPQASNGE